METDIKDKNFEDRVLEHVNSLAFGNEGKRIKGDEEVSIAIGGKSDKYGVLEPKEENV